MVSIAQIERGVGRWVDAELMPLIPTGGQYDNLKRIGVAAGAVYVIRKGKTVLMTLRDSSFLNALGAVDANGDIDIEGVKEVLAEKIPETGIKVNIPILNEVTFYRRDLDSVYAYIMGG